MKDARVKAKWAAYHQCHLCHVDFPSRHVRVGSLKSYPVVRDLGIPVDVYNKAIDIWRLQVGAQ